MADADEVGVALRRGARSERGVVDRFNDHRPRHQAQHQDRRDGGLSAAAHDQHPARLCRQHDDSGDVLGRLQPRRFDHQTRTARLITKRAHACASSRHC